MLLADALDAVRFQHDALPWPHLGQQDVVVHNAGRVSACQVGLHSPEKAWESVNVWKLWNTFSSGKMAAGQEIYYPEGLHHGRVQQHATRLTCPAANRVPVSSGISLPWGTHCSCPVITAAQARV